MAMFTLKRIIFKAGMLGQASPAAEIVLLCDNVDHVMELAPHIGKDLELAFMAVQPELPLDERANGTLAR